MSNQKETPITPASPRKPAKPQYFNTPAVIMFDRRIPSLAKNILSFIVPLCKKEGYCWAENEYFARIFGKTDRTVTRAIALLIKLGHIEQKLRRRNGRTTRRITLKSEVCREWLQYLKRQKRAGECLDIFVQERVDKNVQYNKIINSNSEPTGQASQPASGGHHLEEAQEPCPAPSDGEGRVAASDGRPLNAAPFGTPLPEAQTPHPSDKGFEQNKEGCLDKNVEALPSATHKGGEIWEHPCYSDMQELVRQFGKLRGKRYCAEKDEQETLCGIIAKNGLNRVMLALNCCAKVLEKQKVLFRFNSASTRLVDFLYSDKQDALAHWIDAHCGKAPF